MFTPDIHLEESDSEQIFYEAWIPRRKSNDSFFGQLINAPIFENRNLIFDYQQTEAQEKPKIFKPKTKTAKIKKPCDYKKNICGYITKKIIRQYLSSTYLNLAQSLCAKHGCSYAASKSYFLSRIERITGPSHIPGLFVAESIQEGPIKNAFKQFFVWFTKQRYLRYLILEGKMEQKQAYIEYKNTILMSLVDSQKMSETISSNADSTPESS